MRNIKENRNRAGEREKRYKSKANEAGYRSKVNEAGYRSKADEAGYRSKADETGYRSKADETGYRSKSDKAGCRSKSDEAGYRPGIEDVRDAEGTGEDGVDTSYIEGRNEVIEAFRSGKTIDRVFILDGSHDGKLDTIRREAKKAGVRADFVDRKRLDSMSVSGNHQGVVARAAAYRYAEVSDILDAARAKGEDPFIFILDGIEDPHNLGAIIRTADLAGAHGVIIPKDRAVGLTPTVAKASAGAINYVPVAKVTNLARTMEDLKEEGLWFTGADMDGETMYDCDLKGPAGLVIGAEGRGLSRLLKERCDRIVSIPTAGHIDSLNASVAAGILAFEVVRQRRC